MRNINIKNPCGAFQHQRVSFKFSIKSRKTIIIQCRRVDVVSLSSCNSIVFLRNVTGVSCVSAYVSCTKTRSDRGGGGCLRHTGCQTQQKFYVQLFEVVCWVLLCSFPHSHFSSSCSLSINFGGNSGNYSKWIQTPTCSVMCQQRAFLTHYEFVSGGEKYWLFLNVLSS